MTHGPRRGAAGRLVAGERPGAPGVGILRALPSPTQVVVSAAKIGLLRSALGCDGFGPGSLAGPSSGSTCTCADSTAAPPVRVGPPCCARYCASIGRTLAA
jgi:hypothetical protein